jgi:hypothetical protein
MDANLVLVALVGAAGAFLVVDGFVGVLPRRKSTAGLEGGLALRGEGGDEQDRITVLQDAPFLDRLLTPLLGDLVGGVSEEKRQDVASKLRRSGWKYRSVADYYATRVLLAGLFFLGGGVFIFVSQMGVLFWVPLALGALGYFMPEREVQSAIAERRKRVATEMAFSLDRLALLMRAGVALQEAMGLLAEAPGGAFVAALRRVARSIASGSKTPAQALADFEADLPEDPEVVQFSARIRAGLAGTPISGSLLVQAERLRAALNARLLKQGLQTVLIITTVGAAFMLPALAIIVLGPPLMLAFQIF